MVQNQATNLQNLNLNDLDLDSLNALQSMLSRSRSTMNELNGLSHEIGNVGDKFDKVYKDFDGYQGELAGATTEDERNKIYANKYKEIAQTNQNTVKAKLENLEYSYNDLDNEAQKLEKLKQKSRDAVGNLEVQQANNELLAYQIEEMRKLRMLMMDQASTNLNDIAAQNNQKMLQRARTDEFFGGKSTDLQSGIDQE